MKKVLFVFAIVGLLFGFAGCDTNNNYSPQRYDFFEFIVTQSAFEAIDEEFYGVEESTRSTLDAIRIWITLNASPQAYTLRGLTREEITDLLLETTTLTRSQINAIFADAASIGKAMFILSFGDNWGIYFVERI